MLIGAIVLETAKRRPSKVPGQRAPRKTDRMKTVQIILPDALANEAAQAGLLAPERIERLLRDRLRQERIEQMQAARAALADEPPAPMTSEEINAEIDAYRAGQRRAAGS